MNEAHVGYSKEPIAVIDPNTGDASWVYLFLGCLAGYTYVATSWDREQGSWIESHLRMMSYFRGCPRFLVPEKGRVPKRNLDDIYHEMALHYGVVALAPRRGGLEVESRLTSYLRQKTFHATVDVEEAAEIFLDEDNQNQHQEREELLPLPSRPYTYRRSAKAAVHLDSHIQLEGHFYSVPCQLIGERVCVRFNTQTVDIYHNGIRVAHHKRSLSRGYSTVGHHLGSCSGKKMKWTPGRLESWASRVGPYAQRLIGELINSRAYPEQGFRASIGLLGLADGHGQEKLEAACKRAVAARVFSYARVRREIERA